MVLLKISVDYTSIYSQDLSTKSVCVFHTDPSLDVKNLMSISNVNRIENNNFKTAINVW